ncbi:MAG: fatty acid desaturase [Acetobacteraceae bacterium]
MADAADHTNEAVSAKSWSRIVAHYRTPNVTRSVTEILITAVPLAAIWLCAWLLTAYGMWWAVLLTVPAAGFLVRLFMIQHDCGHGALFHSRAANDWVGRITGVFTLTPYSSWRQSHGSHHANVGNLGRRGFGDIDTLTVDEYRALSRWRRLLYRLYRHPLVLFGVGPTFVFFLQQRLPMGSWAGTRPWVGVMGTNLGIGAVVATGIVLFGVAQFLLIYVPTLMLASTIGLWLFYIQHQFEFTSWEHQPDWTQPDAALHGSSFYDLPRVLRWFTANIGLHHVHHLNSRIPFYRTAEVLRDYPQLRDIGRMTLRDSLATLSLRLWDVQAKRLVSFREAARLMAARANEGHGALTRA